jgi:hypothetical protein
LFTHNYKIVLHKKKDDFIFSDAFEVDINDSEFFKELISLKNNEKDRCCFAHGMADIDIYKVKDRHNYVIHHSPSSGLHIQYIISEEEFEKILDKINPRYLKEEYKRIFIEKDEYNLV